MQIKVLLFATLKDIAGQNRLTLTLPDGQPGCLLLLNQPAGTRGTVLSKI